MIHISTPDADGRVVHEVQAYNTLIKISEAYSTSVEKILANNGLQLDAPLQIGQKLVINPGNFTPSPTPRPLTPIERLTPASDGKYYHTVSSGETLSWISGYYGVSLSELMSWNGLSASSVIIPGQALLLQVTPPPSETPVPPPATDTPPPPTPAPATATPSPAPAVHTPTQTQLASSGAAGSLFGNRTAAGAIILVVAIIAGGLILAGFFARRKPNRRRGGWPSHARYVPPSYFFSSLFIRRIPCPHPPPLPRGRCAAPPLPDRR